MTTRREYIMNEWDCITFARDVLGWPVYKPGDRVQSIHPGRHRNKNLVIYSGDYWRDWKEDIGGTVIDLCAYTMFDGDVGAAMDYLAGDFHPVEVSYYRKAYNDIAKDIDHWHNMLDGNGRRYLYSRRITDETIDRLKIGLINHEEINHYDQYRISIPYWDNKKPVYWVARDLSNSPNAHKYIKTKIDGDEYIANIPWGLHTIGRAKKSHDTQLSIDFTESRIDKSEWLVICEGAFDGLSFEQEGYCVLASMGGSFNWYSLRRVISIAKTFRNVLVIYDNDKAGQEFTRKMAKILYQHRINFFCGLVPEEYNGQPCKDVSDYYCANGNLEDLVIDAYENHQGIKDLAGMLTSQAEVREFLYSTARFADKADMMELVDTIRSLKRFPPHWLRTIRDESVKAPSEGVIVEEVMKDHSLKYVEGVGFFEYVHGQWKKTSENMVKFYADQALGRYSTNSRMHAVMNFAKARTTTMEEMNTQHIFNCANGVVLLDEGCEFVPHDENFLSTVQTAYNYDPNARCPKWINFIDSVTGGDRQKMNLLQEMGGYILWPDNSLERAFFLMGDGGNGKGTFMDTLRDVFGSENCSALELSQLGGDFNPIMLRYSLANLAGENRVDLKNSEARFKGVVSGDDMIAAHKGVDAVKFSPRCKLFISCNEFINTSQITHAFMRRLKFIRFNRNYVQLHEANTNLRKELRGELPGILNWCIQGYLRLLKQGDFTQTEEDTQQKQEFMMSVNPVAAFIEECLSGISGQDLDTLDIYPRYTGWCDDSGHKKLSRHAFTTKLRTVMRELRPDVDSYKNPSTKRYHFIFPVTGFDGIEIPDE